MSIDFCALDLHSAAAAAGWQEEPPLPLGLVKSAGGLFFDAGVTAATLQAAVGQIFFANTYFQELDYAVFIKALYDIGPALPQVFNGELLIRFASAIAPFDALRRTLYKSVKISDGEAEYYFEPVFLGGAEDAPAATLDFDEFVADLWCKGICFGILPAAVKAAIASGAAERIVVARRLEATPGQDAAIVEVSLDIHRNDAPLELANGRFNLLCFKNRFPQVKRKVSLLRKVARTAGLPGCELSGLLVKPAAPQDIDLSAMAGPGTAIEHQRDGEFLVAQQDGFLSVDAKTSQISINAKIVSRDGVSGRTTGNLQLTGAYEEFGEVQEMRVVEGGDITIHGDVFGQVNSRGGDIILDSNVMGGGAFNAGGNIKVKGRASGAVLQSVCGEVLVQWADNCVISGTRVVIEQAFNCEIIADEVVIKVAKGCAVAGRKIEIDSAGPRKQSEMLVHPLLPDTARFEQKIAELNAKADALAQSVQKGRHNIERITGAPEVGNYMTLATKVRKLEVVLTPEQLPQFQKMALQVGPSLKALGQLVLNVKEMELARTQMIELAQQVAREKRESAGQACCIVRLICGETLVRSMKFDPDGGAVYHFSPREIKRKLRGTSSGAGTIFSGSSGTLEWFFDAAQP